MRNIIAKEGYVFTEAADIPLQERLFAKKLYLGICDSPDNWKEITEEEYNKMQEELRAMIDGVITKEKEEKE